MIKKAEDLEEQRIDIARRADAHREVSGEEWRPTRDEYGEHGAEDFDGLAFCLDRIERFLLAILTRHPQHAGHLKRGAVLPYEALEFVGATY